MAIGEVASRRPLRRAAWRWSGSLQAALLGLLCGTSALTVVGLGTRLTFFNDDWYFLLQRPGLESHGGIDVLLAPHNGNLVAIPAALYKVLLALFGLSSQVSFRLLLAAAIIGLGIGVYRLVAERLGPALGVGAAAVVMFLGAAWDDLLFFASIDLVASLAAGVWALVLLERDSARRNLAVCALLVCATASSNAGIPFVVGSALAILLRRRPGQLWIAAVPALLFGLWWAFYGSSEPSHISAMNIEHLPVYVLQAFSSGLSSATGLDHWGVTLQIGYGLAALALLALIIRAIRAPRPRAWALVPAATLLTFWILTGAGYIPGRDPTASRYQLIAVTLLIVLGAELVRDLLLSPRCRSLLVFLGALVVASNLLLLRSGYDFLRVQSQYVKAELGALEISGPRTPPNVWLIQPVALDPYLSGITAGRYFAVTRSHGSPGFYTPDQIAAAPEQVRRAADSVLVRAEQLLRGPLSAGAAPPASSVRRPCTPLAAGAGGPGPALALGPGPVVVRNPMHQTVVIGLERFAGPRHPTYVGILHPAAPVRLLIRRDRVSTPWRLSILAPAGNRAISVRVCR